MIYETSSRLRDGYLARAATYSESLLHRSRASIISYGSARSPAHDRDSTIAGTDDVDDARSGVKPSRDWLQISLASIGEAVMTTDTLGVVTFLNPVAETYTGRTQAEAIGVPLGLVFHIIAEDTRKPSANPSAQALRAGASIGLLNHSVLVAKDGTERPIEYSAAPVRDSSGEIGGAVLVFRDVSERRAAGKSLADSEMRYRRLFETANDGIILLDATTGKIVDANALICALLGRELWEILGMELHEIGVFADREANKAAFHELQAKGYLRYDHLPLQRRDGHVSHVEFISNVYREDDRVVAQCNVRDISARIALEQLKVKAEALAEQQRRTDEFLATLSHELRNPLAPIRNATQLLRLQQEHETPIQRQAREVIERQVSHLTTLVSDLLEVSRVSSGRIRLDQSTVDLRQAVHYAMQTVAPLLERRKQELSPSLPDEPVWVHVDPTRIEQVVVNLLTNASKFTNERGQIWMTVERDGGYAIMRVVDSGIGIAAEVLPHVFELFVQADQSLDRAQGGLGVGLSLVQRIVELHGGTVQGHSVGLGSGSEFVVRLPLVPEPARRATPSGTPSLSPSGKGLRVLVVDDNVDSCLMLANYVRLQGYDAGMAHTGPAALVAAALAPPDIVLLDIGLPGIDGFEVARQLRKAPATRHAKLMALTGYGTEKDQRLTLEAGFDVHLLKPVDMDLVDQHLAPWKESPVVRADQRPGALPLPLS